MKEKLFDYAPLWVLILLILFYIGNITLLHPVYIAFLYVVGVCFSTALCCTYFSIICKKDWSTKNVRLFLLFLMYLICFISGGFYFS